MGPVERFTRDAASKYVWAVSMLVAIVALVFTFARGGDAVDAERLTAQRRAVDAVAQVVEPRIDASDLEAPIAEQELTGLRAALERTTLSDPRVVRLRIWSDDGRLWFSSDADDRLGSEGALNDQILGVAADGRAITRSNLSDTGGSDERGRSLLRTYTPLGSTAVAEVNQTSEGTIAPVQAEWRSYQIIVAALVGLFLLLTILSLREPLERINTGVAFAASSIPEGYSLIDDDRLHAVEEVYRLAHDRVARLQEKLEQSEAMRRRLEGDIQRALTKAHTETGKRPAASAGTPPVPAAEPATAATPPQASPPTPSPAPAMRPAAAATPKTNGDAKRVIEPTQPPPAVPPMEPEIVTLPEFDALAETWAATAPGGPLARATREDTSHPELQPKRRAEKPKRTSRLRRKSEAEPEPEAAAQAGPMVIPPAKPEKPKRASRLSRRQVPAPTAAVAPTAPAPPPAPAVPTAQPAAVPAPVPAAVTQEIDDAKAHEAALEMFIRLTESDRQHAEATEVDQGAVRAALARTAARKKPGGHRLQPHEDGGSSGGPPRRS
ncbi:MAG TPA: hypothetical protein VE800_03960 [Actinomycetota bacterium]|nr:hypothetical protein [Actinomycetota bacterium]